MSKLIDQFHIVDAAMEQYMGAWFCAMGGQWRDSCHQSAKIAAAALALVFPEHESKAQLAELIAKMEGGRSFAHVGWKDDPNVIEGRYPMHWVVKCGAHLYDPTFWQLRKMKTPLRLPKEPYFFMENWFERAAGGRFSGEDGFTWAEDGGHPALKIGYCMRSDALPSKIAAQLMTAEQAGAHGRMVFDIYEEMERR